MQNGIKTVMSARLKKVVKEHSITSASPLKGRLLVTMSCSSISICLFFCDAPLEHHKAVTLNLDTNAATELKDTILLANLSSGDMVAKDAVYHKHCLTGLFTRCRSSIRQKEPSVFNDKLSCEAMALAELVSYIEEMRQTEECIFKLSSIVNLYKTRLEQLGGAIAIMRAAALVRKEIFQNQYRFQGSLLDEQYDDNPSSLLALVQVILGGTNIENQKENNNNGKCSALSITLLLVFNAVKRSRKDTNAVRHNLDRETRLPLYHGLLVYFKTRKGELTEAYQCPMTE